MYRLKDIEKMKEKQELLEFLKHEDGKYHHLTREQIDEQNKFKQSTSDWLKV
jgi:hypothetical protein